MIRASELDYETTQALAAAIVRQAADDYATIYMGGRCGMDPERMLHDIKRFLASELYGSITEIPGEELLRIVRIRELSKCVRILREVLADPERAEIHVRVRRERKDGATIRGRLPDRAEFLGLAALETRLGSMEALLREEETGRHYDNERPQTLTDPPRMRRRDRRQMEQDMELLYWATVRPSSAFVTVKTRKGPTRKCPSGGTNRYALPPKLANDIIAILRCEMQDIKMELKTTRRDGDDPRDTTR